MVKKTKKAYEEYLNVMFTDVYTVGEIVENYGHLAIESKLEHYHNNHMIGTIQRRKDPITFEVGYNEWCRE